MYKGHRLRTTYTGVPRNPPPITNRSPFTHTQPDIWPTGLATTTAPDTHTYGVNVRDAGKPVFEHALVVTVLLTVLHETVARRSVRRQPILVPDCDRPRKNEIYPFALMWMWVLFYLAEGGDAAHVCRRSNRRGNFGLYVSVDGLYFCHVAHPT